LLGQRARAGTKRHGTSVSDKICALLTSRQSGQTGHRTRQSGGAHLEGIVRFSMLAQVGWFPPNELLPPLCLVLCPLCLEVQSVQILSDTLVPCLFVPVPAVWPSHLKAFASGHPVISLPSFEMSKPFLLTISHNICHPLQTQTSIEINTWYFGCIAYNALLKRTAATVSTRNNLLNKLAGSTWDTSNNYNYSSNTTSHSAGSQ